MLRRALEFLFKVSNFVKFAFFKAFFSKLLIFDIPLRKVRK